MVIEKEQVFLENKQAAVFGQGRLIGKPISDWLESQGVEVFRIDEHTENATELSKQADLVISGVGKPDLITAQMVKDGAIVIDFGYGRKGDKMVGDVVFDEVAPKASLITPVPGGMGPLVIAAVLQNLVNL
jgi:methylenetetrahydrofolate dehydrogenase (NADP+)/methenyltetrahydrofolate cyclohydrolase